MPKYRAPYARSNTLLQIAMQRAHDLHPFPIILTCESTAGQMESSALIRCESPDWGSILGVDHQTGAAY